uniref:Ephrin-A3a n=1 Tax=Hucho hucho TaxID=62062 RepID=A0A4W5P5H0_9TELE
MPGKEQWLRDMIFICLCMCVMQTKRRGKTEVSMVEKNTQKRSNGYTVQVAVNDYLDIYCPHYNTTAASQRGTLERTVAEQYVLYMVSYRGYRTCDPQMGFKRWECNRPHAPHAPIKFSEKFQRYSAFSLGYEFNVGHEYYYICEWNISILSLYRNPLPVKRFRTPTHSRVLTWNLICGISFLNAFELISCVVRR